MSFAIQRKFQLYMWAALATMIFHAAGCITPKKGPRKAYKYAATTLPPFDAIIVPGIPFNNGAWDSVMKARVLWAAILYKNGVARNVIFSGGAVYSAYIEAKIMGLYGQKLGIPAEHIFYETQARHSTENVYYSYLVARQKGFKSLALATDPFQARLLKRFIRNRFTSPIYLLPFVTDSLAVYNNKNPLLLPEEYEKAKVENFIAITETEGFFKRLRGTFGKDIDWSKYKDGRLDAL